MEALSFVFVGVIIGAGVLLTLAVRRDIRDRQERARSLHESNARAAREVRRRGPH